MCPLGPSYPRRIVKDTDPAPPAPEARSTARFLVSFRYAFRGVRWMARHEPNMRFHLLATVAVVAAAGSAVIAGIVFVPHVWELFT